MNYLRYLRHMAPDLAPEDILRLHDFRPRLTRMAASIRMVLRGMRGRS